VIQPLFVVSITGFFGIILYSTKPEGAAFVAAAFYNEFGTWISI